jgi:hypothetical protein
MNGDAMIAHANEPEHISRVREKAGVGQGGWDTTGWGPVEWGEPNTDELARWMPSKEELERENAEKEKRERILRWIEDVEAAR